jgi:hypothetical protein
MLAPRSSGAGAHGCPRPSTPCIGSSGAGAHRCLRPDTCIGSCGAGTLRIPHPCTPCPAKHAPTRHSSWQLLLSSSALMFPNLLFGQKPLTINHMTVFRSGWLAYIVLFFSFGATKSCVPVSLNFSSQPPYLFMSSVINLPEIGGGGAGGPNERCCRHIGHRGPCSCFLLGMMRCMAVSYITDPPVSNSVLTLINLSFFTRILTPAAGAPCAKVHYYFIHTVFKKMN